MARLRTIQRSDPVRGARCAPKIGRAEIAGRAAYMGGVDLTECYAEFERLKQHLGIA